MARAPACFYQRWKSSRNHPEGMNTQTHTVTNYNVINSGSIHNANNPVSCQVHFCREYKGGRGCCVCSVLLLARKIVVLFWMLTMIDFVAFICQNVEGKPMSIVGTQSHLSHTQGFGTSTGTRCPLEPPKITKPWSLSCLRPAPPLKPSAALGYKEVRDFYIPTFHGFWETVSQSSVCVGA